MGKEKRKDKPSAEGKLGVEGIDKKLIMEAFEKAGVTSDDSPDIPAITKLDLYEMGLTGGRNSTELRRKLLEYLGLPSLLTSNSLLEVLNHMLSLEELEEIMKNKIRL